MGGNALKSVNCVRVNLEAYNLIKTKVISLLLTFNSSVVSVLEQPEKESFGDLDLLYNVNDKHMIDVVNDLFQPKEMVQNWNVISFSFPITIDTEYFQIDLIKITKNIEMAQFYFGYHHRHHSVRHGPDALHHRQVQRQGQPGSLENHAQYPHRSFVDGHSNPYPRGHRHPVASPALFGA